MQTHYHFFMRHAGYSYDPKTQTPLQGRIECAKRYARAEKTALLAGYSFEWSIDPDCTSAEWSEEEPAWAQWQCLMHDPYGNVVASLSGIDFGRDGSPWGDPYRRCVQAELAIEVLARWSYAEGRELP